MSLVRILRHETYCQAQLQIQLQFQLELSIALISFFSPPPTYPQTHPSFYLFVTYTVTIHYFLSIV